MTRIRLENEEKTVRDFFSHLPDDPEGSILELRGKPVARVLPVTSNRVDSERLKAAILNRRKASRTQNEDWSASDSQTWDRSGPV
jgi:hypothetical protein